MTIITETWTNNSDKINQLLKDYEDKSSYSIIRRDRERGRGGGVAVLFNRHKIQMARARLPQSDFEVLAGIGRRQGQRRKVCVVAVYLPPWYNAAKNRRCLQFINDCLVLLNSRYNDPYIFLRADFNNRDVKQAIKDLPRIKIIKTAATRGHNILDIIARNATADVTEFGVRCPITDNNNVGSDHGVVYASLRMTRVPAYSVREYSYLHVNDEGIQKFG